MDISENLIIALVGVGGTLAGTAIGWGLTELTKARDARTVIRNKRNAMKAELADLIPGLDLGIAGIRDECEAFGRSIGKRYFSRPTPVNTPVCSIYYPEIVYALTDIERKNLKLIFDWIYNVNTTLAKLTHGDHGSLSQIEKFDLRWLVYLHFAILKTLTEEVLENFSKKVITFDDARLKSTRQEVEHFRECQFR